MNTKFTNLLSLQSSVLSAFLLFATGGSVYAQQMDHLATLNTADGEITILCNTSVNQQVEHLRHHQMGTDMFQQQNLLEQQANGKMQLAHMINKAPNATVTYLEKLDRVESERHRTNYTYGDNGSYTVITTEKNGNNWVNVSKTENIYNATGTEFRYASYNWTDGAWNLNYKYDESYDENGNLSTRLEYLQVDGEWVPSAKTEWEYNSLGKTTKSTNYKLVNGNWQISGLAEAQYHANGNMSSHIQCDYKDGELVSESQYDYYEDLVLKHSYNRWYDYEYEYWSDAVYDTDGKRVESSSAGERYDSYQKVVYYEKSYTKYNANGDITEEIWYQWNGNEWVLRGKQECTYDDKGRITTDFTYEWADGDWKLTAGIPVMLPDGTLMDSYTVSTRRSRYSAYENDNHERVEKCDVERYSNGTWSNEPISYGHAYVKIYSIKGLLLNEERGLNKWTYEYDADGNLINKYQYLGTSGKWEALNKSLYKYDDMGNMIEEICYNWSSTKYEWQVSYSHAYAYNKMGLMTLDEYLVPDRNYGYRYEYVIDEQGNYVYQYYYRYSDNAWQPYQKYEYPAGCTSETTSYYDGFYYSYQDGEWVVTSGHSTVYDEYGDRLEYVTAASWEGHYKSVYTYDYNVLGKEVYPGLTSIHKCLTETRTDLDTNEVEHYVYYYSPYNAAGISAIEYETSASVIYDLSGRRVIQIATCGICITKGKKVIR